MDRAASRSVTSTAMVRPTCACQCRSRAVRGRRVVRVHTDGAAERALIAGLNVAGTSFEVGYSSLGVRAASVVPLDNGMVLIPRGALA